MNIPITQDMLNAVGDCIETATVQDDMIGIAFLEIAGGKIAIYNVSLKQALTRRFDNVPAARAFAVNRLMDRSAR